MDKEKQLLSELDSTNPIQLMNKIQSLTVENNHLRDQLILKTTEEAQASLMSIKASTANLLKPFLDESEIRKYLGFSEQRSSSKEVAVDLIRRR